MKRFGNYAEDVNKLLSTDGRVFKGNEQTIRELITLLL